jgi:signal transduction histidine kinase
VGNENSYSNAVIRIEVEDTGNGISKENQVTYI